MEELNKFATAIRAVTCEMFVARKDGHIGGSFSIVETLAVLFGKYIKDNPKDWFVLSKGHAGPAYYAALMLKGKLPYENVATLNENGTLLPSHPDRNLTPGVDCSTGSLGQGVSQAVGLAYGINKKNSGAYVYCIVGDGELNEGEVWEALEFASNKHLNNLIIFIDDNKKQVDGLVKDVSCDYDFDDLFASLHLNHVRVNGQETSKIDECISSIRSKQNSGTWVVILETEKGQGIRYFSDMDNCHHLNFNDKELEVLNEYYLRNKEVIKDVMESN